MTARRTTPRVGIGLRVEQDLRAELDAYSAATGRTLNRAIEWLLGQALQTARERGEYRSPTANT